MATTIGLFESYPGNTSSTRVMFVIGLAWSMLMTTLGLFLLKWGSGEAIAFLTATSAIFVGLKLGQKPMENKSNNNVGQITN